MKDMSDSESDVSDTTLIETPIPEVDRMAERKEKRLAQLAATRQKAQEVRAEKSMVKGTIKKKRKDLQAQVDKALYDKELARVEEILKASERVNREHEERMKRRAAPRPKKTPAKTKASSSKPDVTDQERATNLASDGLETMMRQLYSGS